MERKRNMGNGKGKGCGEKREGKKIKTTKFIFCLPTCLLSSFFLFPSIDEHDPVLRVGSDRKLLHLRSLKLGHWKFSHINQRISLHLKIIITAVVSGIFTRFWS
uniref:Transmembrane protein n=1 Tax=Cacopsylla melanoneura TaxID=428564 RepID=A0A8D8LV03_9HEMI